LLLSMTGFGEAHRHTDRLTVVAEVRTINSRYFKLSVRSGEGYSSLEPQIEHLVRQHIKRGTVQVNLRVDRAELADDYRINAQVLEGYRAQIKALGKSWNVPDPSWESLLQLPGVVHENLLSAADVEQDWPLIGETIEAALQNMSQMRIDEGRAMAADLLANARVIAQQLDLIETRAPLVAQTYRDRLSERITKTLAEHQATLQTTDLVRDVALYAERSDISEEIVRLRSHLQQFATIVDHEESSGRKLEFLTQEMGRETNTIGSKANDVEISRHVIEIKASIERVREMIQNVE
jgi:uncharacterized protein (TIGR00255 family)